MIQPIHTEKMLPIAHVQITYSIRNLVDDSRESLKYIGKQFLVFTDSDLVPTRLGLDFGNSSLAPFLSLLIARAEASSLKFKILRVEYRNGIVRYNNGKLIKIIFAL